MMSWKDALWAELKEMSDLEQIRTAATWIEEITHEVSPALGRHRRELILTTLDRDGMDATRLAEEIGASRNAIKRLAEDARANRREEARRAA